MIEIKNFFRRHYLNDGSHNRFARGDDFFLVSNLNLIEANKIWFSSGPLMYIPGAIVLSVNGVNILTIEDWDYPYWQYGELVGQIDELVKGNDFSIQFLETDSSLRVKKLNIDLCVVEHVVKGKTKAKSQCKKVELFVALITAAKEVFQISDHYGEDCKHELRVLNECLDLWKKRE